MTVHTKKRREVEHYEEYWKITAAFTNFNDQNFITALRVIVDFIDTHQERLKNPGKDFSSFYKKLQNNLESVFDYNGKSSDTTVRKIINQFVKIGFIEPFLKSYNFRVPQYLRTYDEEKRKSLFTEIMFENASFMSSVTKDNRDYPNPVRFLLNTMAMMPKDSYLTTQELAAIMLTDISLPKYKKGYMNREEIEERVRVSNTIDFYDRKYNQVSHLMAHLGFMVDFVYDKKLGRIYLKENLSDLSKINIETTRDPYRYHIFRSNLDIESRELFGEKVCYVTGDQQKALVASHIIPSALCITEGNVDDAYDYNNGIWLSPDIDAYFDKGDITFEEDGTMLMKPGLPPSIYQKMNGYKLDSRVLTPERKKYLKINHDNFIKRYDSWIKA